MTAPGSDKGGFPGHLGGMGKVPAGNMAGRTGDESGEGMDPGHGIPATGNYIGLPFTGLDEDGRDVSTRPSGPGPTWPQGTGAQG